MATTCNFGQIPDFRTKSLCVNNKKVIDEKRNLCVRKINSTSVKSKSLCATKTKTTKISEKISGQSLVVDKPLVLNPHGIGRMYQNEQLVILGSADTFLDPSNWIIKFETFGPSFLLQNNHMIQIPDLDDYPNPCLGNWCALIEVNLSFIFSAINYMGSNADFFGIGIEKNGAPIKKIFLTPKDGDSVNHLHLNDVFKVNPGDYFDIEIITNVVQGNASTTVLTAGLTSSSIHAKLLGFEPQ